ncbi:MAG: NAD(P) transhydrogenase subunit alpha [Verrucomicrobia bacterium]|nr:NAD(P) transhydrogenase subunit alpha [Verrucomicrobiota bacterium]
MRIFVPKEIFPGEKRVAVSPITVAKLVKLGVDVEVEQNLGASVNWPDSHYETAGARLSSSRRASLRGAELILRVRKPPFDEIDDLKAGGIHISLLDPFNEEKLVRHLAGAQVTAVSMEMIPRVTVAQPMDVLSSQANLVGYVSVILAANAVDRIFPMMTTAAGMIKPLRMFVIGVGVAGLQAIATGRRLGAWVEAFDTRPVVEEQVKSLGAKFVKLDLGETGETAGGYAKELTTEQLQRQRQLMADHVVSADVVITAAQVFGKKAPVIITSDLVQKMRPGSVVVDTAVETGGNVEGSMRDQEVTLNGVKIVGFANLASRVASHASEMYSNNLGAFVQYFWNRETKAFGLDLTHEILKACVVTHGGEIINQTILQTYAQATS